MLRLNTKAKTCTILAHQRTLFVPRNEKKNAKNNNENDSIHNNIHEIWSKICSVYAVTLAWKRFLSLKLTQITDNLMKKTAAGYFLELLHI